MGTPPTPPWGVGGGLGGRGMVPGVEMEEVLDAATLGVAIPWPEVERGVLTITNTWSH